MNNTPHFILTMGSRIIHLLSLYLYFCVYAISTSSFTPTDNYLVNCGSNTNVTVDNRVFVADLIKPGSVFLTSGESVSLTNPNPSSNSSSLLYGTARIFKTASAYRFSINKFGTHLVRLHFSPFITQDYDLGNASFSVSANGLLILRNFSAKNPVFKEFVLMVDKVNFELLFVPIAESGLGFVCAIEVFSTPDDFILDNGVKLISPNGVQEFKDLRLQTLETIHRINVGGPKLTPFNDTLWRTWVPDEEFLLLKSTARLANTTHTPNYQKGGATREIAPDNVYMTAQQMNRDNTTSGFSYFNVTWDFPVRTGSVRHFVRLHFCDIVSIALNQLYFDVYINGFVAYKDVDLSSLTFHSLASPYYIDFVVDSENSGIVRVSIGPSDLSNVLRKNAILNGVEIMRIVLFLGLPAEGSKKISKWIVVGIIVGGVAAVCLAVLAVLVVLRSKRRKAKPRPAESMGWTRLRGFGGSSHSKQSLGTTSTSPGQNGYLGLKIPFAELESGTNNFDKNLVIGSGGFGMVYKGVLKDSTRVAVKRGVRGSRQGLPEFQTEITVLSKIRHRHLVSLVGYCEEQSEMILVYEYMEKGALKNHLYGSNLPPLSWKQRLEICIGAARGLHYLHTGSAQGIIHRDIKSTNILLDENYVAKVADFGLSRSGPCLDETHVSTGVKGSFGYLDPEYFRRQQLTDKSDVYSFGVVLFEVLCARPAVDPLLDREQVNLAEWAMERQKKGLLAHIIDPNLVGKINPNSLKKFVETAEKCLAEYGVDRPTMGDVLWNLEYALQLQDSKQCSDDTDNTTPEGLEHEAVPTVYSCSSRTDGDIQDATIDMTSGEIFSQLVNKEGR